LTFLPFFVFGELMMEELNVLLDRFPHNSPANLGELWGNLSKNENGENSQLAIFAILCDGAWLRGGSRISFHDMYLSGGRMK